MIGKIIALHGWTSINQFIVLDKVLSTYGHSHGPVTMYLCQLQQKDGLGKLVLALPQDIYFPFIPKEVVL